MLKNITVSVVLAITTVQPVMAAAPPPCPSGTEGVWEWSATAEKTRIFYKGGDWDLGPDLDLPQGAKPEIELTEIAENGKKPVAYLNAVHLPKGLSSPLANGNYLLFDRESHKFNIGLAQPGREIELEVISGWSELAKFSKGLFGTGGWATALDGAINLRRMVNQPGVLGLFITLPMTDGVQDEAIAVVILPEEGRASAWNAAIKASTALAAKVNAGPGCKEPRT